MIREDGYAKLTNRLFEVCNSRELQAIVNGDFAPLKKVIVDELMLNDYNGVFLDILFEDLFSQKKKPILRTHMEEFTDFLMTDISLFLLQHYISKRLK